MSLDVTMVVARARNGVIGFKGAMPWHLPADLKRFKAITVGKPVVNVFIPAAPAPTSGFILQVPPEEIRETKLKVSEALGLLMSFGAVIPKAEDQA